MSVVPIVLMEKLFTQMNKLLSIILVLAVAWIIFYHNRKGGEIRVTTDTIIIYDTVVIREPILVYNEIKGLRQYTVKLLGTIDKDSDSVTIELPIEQKTYEDSTYKVWVSGYDAKLDSLRIYQPTRYITITTTEEPSRWSYGIQLGIGMTPRGMQPYIGFGGQFRF